MTGGNDTRRSCCYTTNMTHANRTALYLSTAGLTALLLGLAFIAWLSNRGDSLTIYAVFPIFGLSAYILMAMHYISGSLKRYLGLAHETSILKHYFTATSYTVLVLILLHPGLLFFGLWRDGLGPPPVSGWMAYPEQAARAALLLGSIGLTIFLLFELHHWCRQKRWWKYIEYASVGGMALIFLHSMILGGELISGWFRLVWILMGWALAMSIIYNFHYDRSNKRSEYATAKSTSKS